MSENIRKPAVEADFDIFGVDLDQADGQDNSGVGLGQIMTNTVSDISGKERSQII